MKEEIGDGEWVNKDWEKGEDWEKKMIERVLRERMEKLLIEIWIVKKDKVIKVVGGKRSIEIEKEIRIGVLENLIEEEMIEKKEKIRINMDKEEIDVIGEKLVERLEGNGMKSIVIEKEIEKSINNERNGWEREGEKRKKKRFLRIKEIKKGKSWNMRKRRMKMRIKLGRIEEVVIVIISEKLGGNSKEGRKRKEKDDNLRKVRKIEEEKVEIDRRKLRIEIKESVKKIWN